MLCIVLYKVHRHLYDAKKRIKKVKPMRLLPIACLAALIACAPSTLAQTPPANADTYAAILQHGVVIVTPDFEIDVQFKPDGTFTALGGASKGVWKIVGDKMCSTPDETLIESCAVYPAGKTSGDTFELDAPGARVPVRIP